MLTFIHQEKQFSKLILLSAIGLSSIVSTSNAQTNSQIHISQQQIARSGIKIEAATVASDSALSANANLSDKGLRLSGTVVAATSATQLLSAVVSGVIQSIHVNPLQEVKAGTPIATIFSQQLMEMQREYLQFATQAQLAQDKVNRDENLFKEGIVSQSRVQESRALAIQSEVAASERRQSLKAAGLSDNALKQLLKTRSLVANTAIYAKSKGTVLDLQAQLGQRVEAGMPIAKLSGDAPFWIELQASKTQAAQIRIGDLLQIKDCGNAKVMAISPQIEAGNQSITVRAQEIIQAKQASCLRLNQFVEVSHIGHQVVKNSYGVPANALVRNGKHQYVFVKNNHGFEAIEVNVVTGSPDKIWVTGNFASNPQIATQGLVVLKGAWMGLGTEGEDAPPPAATNAAANATAAKAPAKDANKETNQKPTTTSEKK